MKQVMYLSIVVSLLLVSTPVQSEPVDLTGLSCTRHTQFGINTWEFYGSVAERIYPDGQGRPQRFIRIGEGAYEKYSRIDGEWDAIYYFFDVGDGIQVRIFSRPGLIVREDNPKASWERGIFPFAADCRPLWETH
ncbi:hypothetical protein [Pseudosulfitobacter koreensis]|uniref:Secreted protein n=1 Tax=Pseudosulfitobacter koreensis TaxID=2968472 RepID=A0ABT1Z3A8_9RHOB|nr:hypothetical protein [Pseudosulfitobacter koreense]MCR8827634.1 hypothetical protein [Pseudosulfitobacter koreense]